MRTEDLIGRLGADLTPVTPLRPTRQVLGWLALATIVLVAAVAMNGLKPALHHGEMAMLDLGQVVASVATGLAALTAAVMLSLPDRPARWALLPLPFLGAWLGSLGFGSVDEMARLGPAALALTSSWECVRFILGAGVPLAGVLLWLLRHAALTRPMPVAAYAGLAAAALSSAGLSQFHGLDLSLMVLIWHGLGTVLLAALMATVGAWVMGR